MPRSPRIALSWPENRPPRSLDAAAIGAALARFLRALGHARSGVAVRFARDADLRRLNTLHRGKRVATDILSWSYLEPGSRTPPPLLGDLALSLDQARRQARQNRWSLQTEVLRLLAHGCAHLVGHDHATPRADRRMLALEEALLARVGLKGLYPAATGELVKNAAPRRRGRRVRAQR